MKHIKKIVAAVAVTAVVAGGAILATNSTTSLPVGALPNSVVTPGVTNPTVTQANIQQTICVSGWTATIRPPASYTTALKIKQLKKLGVLPDVPEVGTSTTGVTGLFEEDHLISLELGGNPTDPNNLWPEKYAEPYGAKDKDAVENYLKKHVCTGQMTLADAQHAISTNWTAVLNQIKQQPVTFGGIDAADPDDN